MRLNASCRIEFQIPVPTPFLLMLRPQSGWQQWIIREEYILSPGVPALEFTDLFGNLCQRIVAPEGFFTVNTSVDIETAEHCDTAFGAPFVEVQLLPPDVLPFLYPSRYCESDRFSETAASVAANRLAGYDQCQGIVNFIRETIRYTPRYRTADHKRFGSRPARTRRLPGYGPSGHCMLQGFVDTGPHGRGIP